METLEETGEHQEQVNRLELQPLQLVLVVWEVLVQLHMVEVSLDA
jgi:hypothetical protein